MPNTDAERNVKPARPVDHASRMESSRARLVASRKLCLSTEVIIREANVTISRTLEILGIGLPRGSRHSRRLGQRQEVKMGELSALDQLEHLQ